MVNDGKPPPAPSPAKKASKKAEVIQPLKAEINFPSIMDLKQALAFDSDGNLIVAIQFKARVDAFEIFRLVNLLKQPHGSLFAMIGSPQTAMDFKFDPKTDKVEVIKAAKKLTAGKAEATPEEPPQVGPITIQDITFNHIPEEKDPFGVCIDFVSDGTGEMHTVAGRGKTATEAVIAGVKRTGGFPADLNEPFELIEALNKTTVTPALMKTVRAIEVGSFDVDEGKGKEGKAESKGD